MFSSLLLASLDVPQQTVWHLVRSSVAVSKLCHYLDCLHTLVVISGYWCFFSTSLSQFVHSSLTSDVNKVFCPVKYCSVEMVAS